MKGWVALTVGAVTGAVVAGVAVSRKTYALNEKARILRASLDTQGSGYEAYLASRGTQIEREVTQLARAIAEEEAHRRSLDQLARVYGFTPELIMKMQRIEAFERQLRSTF